MKNIEKQSYIALPFFAKAEKGTFPKYRIPRTSLEGMSCTKNFYLAGTDNDWFKFLSNLSPDDARMCANQLLAARGQYHVQSHQPRRALFIQTRPQIKLIK